MNTKLTIDNLQKRGITQRKIAKWSLFMSVVVLLGGLYLFVFESPKIAALDNEILKKTNTTSTNKINELVQTNNELESLNLNISKLAQDLLAVKEVTEVDGNQGLPSVVIVYHLENFEETKRNIGYQSKIYLENLRNDLEKAIKYFSTPEAADEYISAPLEKIKNLETPYFETKKRIADLETEYQEYKKRLPSHMFPSNLSRIINSVGVLTQSAKNYEDKIKVLREKTVSNWYERNVDGELKKYISINTKAIADINIRSEAARKNNESYLESEYLMTEELNTLKQRRAFLDAKKQLTSPSIDNSNAQSNDSSKFAFYMSTNIARFGILLITIFFIQIFISIFKYASRMSDFHFARADALELLTPLDEVDLLENLEAVAKIFLPDDINYNKTIKTPTEELIKTIQSLSSKGG